mgnify:CR=1 FL=1
MKTDYEQQLEHVSTLPEFHLGQEVSTPLGLGIIVELRMPFNGLYLEPERSEVTVWFSTADAKGGWVSRGFGLKEIAESYNNSKPDTKEVKTKYVMPDPRNPFRK